jgi:hypothetical protein
LEERKSIQFYSSLDRLKSINDSFDSAVLRIAYHGKNRNKSSISKTAFENAIPSMFNCPVVTHYMYEKRDILGEQGDMGGHDSHMEIDGNGDIRYVVETNPIGVVPESAKYWWETVNDDGELHEYLCTEVLLWKRQEAYNKLKSVKKFSHSMEIRVNEGTYTDDGFFDISNFIFEAFTILGSDVTPCFPSSAIELYSLDKFKEEFSLMLAELKSSLVQEDIKINMEIEVNHMEENDNVVENQESVESTEEVQETFEEVTDTDEVESTDKATDENIESQEDTDNTSEFEEVEEESNDDNSEDDDFASKNKDDMESMIDDMMDEMKDKMKKKMKDLGMMELHSVTESDEYKELNNKFTLLAQENLSLKAEIESLNTYKVAKAKEEKEAIFQEFSVGLSADEMKSVIDDMDKLSVSEIKSKLTEIFTAKTLASLKKEKFSTKENEIIFADVPKKENGKSRYAV